MSNLQSDQNESGANWTAIIRLFSALAIALTVGIVFATNSIQSSASNTGTDIAKRIEAPQNQTNYASVQNDVHNALLAIQTGLTQQPDADVSNFPLTASNAQTQLAASGSAGQFTITGTYTPTGYQYQYSSATGSFAVINAGAVLSTTGATP